MQLKPEIKMALEKIDFSNRCKNLSMKYSFASDESFETYNNNEVLNIFNELGYKAAFVKKENFFKIVEVVAGYKFQFNISLKYGLAELIWAVWKNKELQTGSPWGLVKRLLDDNEDRLRSPIFRNYDDLKGMLEEALVMYEDFKRELLSIYNEVH